jgi:hypothetical protein
MAYFKLTAYDAVEGGILPPSEIEDAKADAARARLPRAVPCRAERRRRQPVRPGRDRACANAIWRRPGRGVRRRPCEVVDWTVVCGLERSDGDVCRWSGGRSDWGQTRRKVIDIIGDVPTLIDSTGVGDPIVEDLCRERWTVEGFKFTAHSKQQFMEGLAATIQRRRGRDSPTGWLVGELESFEYEYRQGGVRYSAPEGLHDDGVCALALAAQAAKAGMAIHLTHMGAAGATAGMTNFEQILGLIKASAVRLDVIDFGTNSPAIAALLERMRHDEELMFAGYFQSPRTGMATQGGTKADAQQHTDTATVSAENLAAAIAGAVNRQIVDDILTLNFGPDAKGSVWVTPGKLTDANLAIDTMILKAVLDNTDGLGTDYLEQVDVDSITDRRGIPHDSPIVLEAVESDPPEPPIDDPTNPDDPNAPPPAKDRKAKG